MDTVLASRRVRDAGQPPLVMQADVAAAPLRRSDGADIALEIREVELPIVTFDGDGGRVIPVVVPFTIGRKVDVAAGGLSRRGFFVADEARPQVGLAAESFKGLEHDRFRAVAEGFEHLADVTLETKSHQHKATRALRGVFERRRIAPERAGAAHARFVKARVREREDPHLVNFAAGNFGQDIETRQDGGVVRIRRDVRLGRAAQNVQVSLRGVAVAVHFDGEFVRRDALDDLVARHPVAARQDVGRAGGHQVIRAVPAHLLRKFLAVVHGRVVDDGHHLAGGEGRHLIRAVGDARRCDRDGGGLFVPKQGGDERQQGTDEIAGRVGHRALLWRIKTVERDSISLYGASKP